MDTAPETDFDKLPSRVSTSEDVVNRASPWAELSSDSLLATHCRVLDVMAEGVTVSDEDGIIQYTNAAEDEMFGYNRGELLGRAVGVQNAGEVDGARPLQTAGAWRRATQSQEGRHLVRYASQNQFAGGFGQALPGLSA